MLLGEDRRVCIDHPGNTERSSAMEVQDGTCAGAEGPGPGGGEAGAPSVDDLWGSSLFDDLSSLVDGDLFPEAEPSLFEENFHHLDFTADLMCWDPPPLTDPAPPGDWSVSSSCSVPSPLAADSPPSSSQFVPEEPDLSSAAHMSPASFYSDGSPSPASVYSDQSGSPASPAEKPHVLAAPAKNNAAAVKQRKLPLVAPKTPIQPKTILIPNPALGATARTIVFQPLTTLLPKPQPLITLQSGPPAGRQVVLAPSALVQLPQSGIIAAQPVLTVNGGTAQIGATPVSLLPHIGLHSEKSSPVTPCVHPSAYPDCDTETSVLRRQQRMIKNRESAFQSRRKKKEYMQTLELRLRAALTENDKLKEENGSLHKLLEEVVSENQKLKVTAPRRRAVCLMMVAVFLMLNFNPLSVWDSSSGEYDLEVRRSVTQNRRLLEFSPGEVNVQREAPPPRDFSPRHFMSTEKALMIVNEEPLLYIPPPPPCRPRVNHSETLRLNHELRGWVHRHEAERTKTRRAIGANKDQKRDGKAEAAELVTVQYTDTSVKNSNELQLYYSSPRSYQDFLDAIRRRGDTFYVVSFRRDHLLLPATNRNKTTRPKMSIILPSMNVNENVIHGPEYEVMMQIDCEVMDTRILHVKSASIPPFLREHRQNQTKSFYSSASSPATEPTHVLGAIGESPL